VNLQLTLANGRSEFSPGEKVSGEARWQLAKRPDRVEIRLFWYTAGKGTVDVGIMGSSVIDEPQSEGAVIFHFTLPDSPYSFSGTLVSLQWAIELVIGKEAARAPLVMGPNAQLVTLGPTPA
jgi:hypothetical protein